MCIKKKSYYSTSIYSFIHSCLYIEFFFSFDFTKSHQKALDNVWGHVGFIEKNTIKSKSQ